MITKELGRDTVSGAKPTNEEVDEMIQSIVQGRL